MSAQFEIVVGPGSEGIILTPTATRRGARARSAGLKVLVAALSVLPVACEQRDQVHAAPQASEQAAQSSVASATPQGEALPDRDPKLAKRLVEEGGALLIDVRRQDEWDERRLPKAHHVPLGELQDRLPEIERLTQGDRSKPLVLYCRSGRRSDSAKQILLQAGYRRVTNLGGIDDWPQG